MRDMQIRRWKTCMGRVSVRWKNHISRRILRSLSWWL